MGLFTPIDFLSGICYTASTIKLIDIPQELALIGHFLSSKLDCNTAPTSSKGCPAKANCGPVINEVEGKTMKTRKQILVAVLLTTTIMTSTAQAGFFDWFTSNKAQAEQAQNGSFDELYASLSSSSIAKQYEDVPTVMASTNAVESVSSPVGGVAKTLRRTYTVEVSGYSSEVAQTDDSPFITASNTHVRDGIVATNMFPFGTVIKIPKLYGDKIFVVEDRMNKRYQNNVDIWFAEKSDAIKLGRRTVQIEVIK